MFERVENLGGHLSGRHNHQNLLWNISVFQLWLENNATV